MRTDTGLLGARLHRRGDLRVGPLRLRELHRLVDPGVALAQPLPIYLVYFTAWEDNGVLKTVPDVYGIDRRHTAAVTGQ